MRVSVIAPTLNEAAQIAHTLQQVRRAGTCELIVVDGGSTDDTMTIARAYADLVLAAPPGRARQMNAGARHASGEILLFLHADTLLPDGFSRVLQKTFDDPRVVGGRFDVRLDAAGWPFRMIETLMNARSRLTRISTGDQAIFVRRVTFEQLGGFPELELMEDIAFSRALKRRGKIACLREHVTASARRWQRDGIGKTILLMWTLRLAYFLGASPRQLKAFYADTR
jgi:rSAM/selenodomain-associated transferase 2